MSSKRRRTWGIAAIVGALFLIFVRPVTLYISGEQFLHTGPNGPETPQTVGIAYQRVKITSGDRKLDGYLVQAPTTCQARAAVLIFHGVGETISEWVMAQRFLYDHCLSSLVFDYSGHGDSSKPGSFGNLDQDAVAAYAFFTAQFAASGRTCVLGFSLGNAPMLESIAKFSPPPSCVVVASAFSSLRDMGARRGTPTIVLYMIPDVWDNVENVARNRSPLLVVHSDSDAVIPISMGRQIFQAAHEPKQFVTLHGFSHNAPYKNPSEDWWNPVMGFIRERQNSYTYDTWLLISKSRLAR